ADRYFDVFAEYAKESPEDILIRVTVANRGRDDAALDLLPTLWFRNTWGGGRQGEGSSDRRRIGRASATALFASHPSFGDYRLEIEPHAGQTPALLFTENETNVERLYGAANATPYVKDAFHRRVVEGVADAVNPAEQGTKAAAWY